MLRISDLRNKDVINSTDGKKLGYIRDVEIDLKQGKIKSLIIPYENKIFYIFSRNNNDDIVVNWQYIKKIGVDVILIEMDKFTPLNQNKNDTTDEDSTTREFNGNPLWCDDQSLSFHN